MKMKDKRKLFINILRTVLLIICGTLIGVNVYLINAKTLAGNDLPMPFGYGAAVVLSGSMEPEFSTGDMIVVKETEDFDIYDIVVYKSGSSLVVHRIVGIGAEKVVTKGDANNTEDEPITRADVLGKVIFHIQGKEPEILEFPCEFELSYELEHIAQCFENGLLTSPVVTEALSVAGIRALEQIKHSW